MTERKIKSCSIKRKTSALLTSSCSKRSRLIDCFTVGNNSKQVITKLLKNKLIIVDNFKEHIIRNWSGLDVKGDQTTKLRNLFQHISFKEDAKKRGKYRALIA